MYALCDNIQKIKKNKNKEYGNQDQRFVLLTYIM